MKRIWVLCCALALAACGPAPQPVKQVERDATEEDWYKPAIAELSDLARRGDVLFRKGDQDGAAALIEKGTAIEGKLLSARQPPLDAMEAASDLDQLYGDMLKTNHNCGWATQFYQKNLSRWKHWPEQTPETKRRFKLAQDAIAECDRIMLR